MKTPERRYIYSQLLKSSTTLSRMQTIVLGELSPRFHNVYLQIVFRKKLHLSVEYIYYKKATNFLFKDYLGEHKPRDKLAICHLPLDSCVHKYVQIPK